LTRVRYIADSMSEAITAARRNHGMAVRIVHAGARPGRGRALSFEVVVEAASAASSARRAARIALARAVVAAHGAAAEARDTVRSVPGAPVAAEALLSRLAIRLRGRGLPEELVELVLGRVRVELRGAGAAELGPALRAAAVDAVAALLPVAAPAPAARAGPTGRPRLIAVAGATGVGKTTTVAKLAAELRMARGMRVGLVAADAFRVGAFEQLRTYARIIDAPVRAADSPASARDAVAAMADCDVLLVDTPGRAPRDAARIAEVAAILAAVRPDETHLVVSGAASAGGQLEAARAFGAVSPTRVVLSKLDEAGSPGSLVAAVRASGVSASWFTTGQEVPDDIEPADARAFAARLVDDAGDGAADGTGDRE
jgi:flagellar biosynthesis protein FlhF